MQLLDRYLHAVRFWLPGKQKDDIIAELSDDLGSAIADREETLGRPLTSDELVEILKRRGHPIVVAGSYLPARSLIGPALFPIYLFVLRIVALCFIAPWTVTWIAVLFSVPGVSAAHGGFWAKLVAVWGGFWTSAIAAFGTVTIIFAAIERFQMRAGLFRNWDPRKLPPALREIPRSASGVELAANIAFAVWWIAMMASREIAVVPSVTFILTPWWPYFFWGFLVIAAALVVLSAVNLVRPYWTATRAVGRLAADAAGAALFCAMLRVGLFETISVASVPAARTALIAHQLNLWSGRVLPLAIVLAVWLVAWDAHRVMRLRKRGFESMTTAVA